MLYITSHQVVQTMTVPRLGLCMKQPEECFQGRDEQGRWYDVEMQCENQPAFVDRILYYWARTFGWQLEEGQGYHELHPVISIIFMDFSLLTEELRYHTCWMWREVESGDFLSELAQIHLIELPKFAVEPNQTESLDSLERWVWFLKEGEKMDQDTMERWGPELVEAYKTLKKLSRDPERWLEYEARLKFFKDQISLQHASREEGREEGLRQAVISVAKQRFPRIHAKTLGSLESLSVPQLQDLLSHMMTFESSAEFRRAIKQYKDTE